MAQDSIDKIIEVGALKGTAGCRTLTTPLVGYHGYSANLHIQLIQEFGIAASVAHRLAKAYGGRARDVLEISRDELGEQGRGGRLIPGLPYLEAEVIYAARFEWAMQADDILARRTRLAFLNKDAALAAIPRVVELMGKELGWSSMRKQAERARSIEYMRHFGGPNATRSLDTARVSTIHDIREAFELIDAKNLGLLDVSGLQLVAEMLGHPLTDEEQRDCFSSLNKHEMGDKLTLQELINWWNSDNLNPTFIDIKENYTATHENLSNSKAGGIFLG